MNSGIAQVTSSLKNSIENREYHVFCDLNGWLVNNYILCSIEPKKDHGSPLYLKKIAPVKETNCKNKQRNVVIAQSRQNLCNSNDK